MRLMRRGGESPALVDRRGEGTAVSRRAKLSSEFNGLLTAFTVSNIGDGVRLTAIPLLAASITSDPTAVASITALVWLPWLLVSLYAGVVVDRVSRIRIALVSQLARGVISALFVLWLVAWRSDSLGVEYVVLAAVALVLGTFEVFADTTMQAIVPNIVEDEDIESALGRFSVSESVSNIMIGPALGAILFATASWLPFAIDAATFVGSWLVLLVFAQRVRQKTPVRAYGGASIRSDLGSGIKYLAGHRLLRTMAMWVASINLWINGAEAVLVLVARDRMGLSEIGFGILISAMGFGGVVGGAVGARIVGALGRIQSMMVASTVGGLCLLGVGLATDLWIAAALQFFIGLAGITFTIVSRAVRHSLTPDELRGRVTGAYRMIGFGAIPLGALIGGVIGSLTSPATAIVVSGAAMTALGLVFGPAVMGHYRATDEMTAS